jgi:hypothetical protein
MESSRYLYPAGRRLPLFYQVTENPDMQVTS